MDDFAIVSDQSYLRNINLAAAPRRIDSNTLHRNLRRNFDHVVMLIAIMFDVEVLASIRGIWTPRLFPKNLSPAG